MLMKLLPPLSSGADPGISKPGARCRRGRIFRGLWIVFVVSVENKKHIVKKNHISQPCECSAFTAITFSYVCIKIFIE